jgi:hypothetical protein
MKRWHNNPIWSARMIDGGRSIESYPTTPKDIMGRRDHPKPHRIRRGRGNNGRKGKKDEAKSRKDKDPGNKKRWPFVPQVEEIPY